MIRTIHEKEHSVDRLQSSVRMRRLPGAHLFLEGAGNKPAELAEAVVDSVTAPLLNDLQEDKTRSVDYLFAAYVTRRILSNF